MESDHGNPDVTHEEGIVQSGLVLRILVGVIVISVTLCVITYLLLVLRESQLRPGRRFPENEMGTPRVVANIRVSPFQIPQATPALKERQHETISTYGWVDRKQGIVRIPVDRAVDVLLANPDGGVR